MSLKESMKIQSKKIEHISIQKIDTHQHNLYNNQECWDKLHMVSCKQYIDIRLVLLEH